MTTADRFVSASARVSRETGVAGVLAEAEKTRPHSPAGRRGNAISTFAAHLELLAKEERPGRQAAGHANASSRAAPLPAGADAGSGIDAGDSNARVLAEETDRGSQSCDDAEASASDDGAVGRDATLDPMVQVLGALAPRTAPPSASAKPEPVVQADTRTSMEQLMAKLVRRVAWSGNARTGVARLELGAGELEGATLIIHADDGLVRVALDLPPGADRAAWKARISERLAVRGLQVESVDVG